MASSLSKSSPVSNSTATVTVTPYHKAGLGSIKLHHRQGATNSRRGYQSLHNVQLAWPDIIVNKEGPSPNATSAPNPPSRGAPLSLRRHCHKNFTFIWTPSTPLLHYYDHLPEFHVPLTTSLTYCIEIF